jgi:hypothetical protein
MRSKFQNTFHNPALFTKTSEVTSARTSTSMLYLFDQTLLTPSPYCRVVAQEEKMTDWSSRLVDVKTHFLHLRDLISQIRGGGG